MKDNLWCLSTDRNVAFKTRKEARKNIADNEPIYREAYGCKPVAVKLASMPAPELPKPRPASKAWEWFCDTFDI